MYTSKQTHKFLKLKSFSEFNGSFAINEKIQKEILKNK